MNLPQYLVLQALQKICPNSNSTSTWHVVLPKTLGRLPFLPLIPTSDFLLLQHCQSHPTSGILCTVPLQHSFPRTRHGPEARTPLPYTQAPDRGCVGGWLQLKTEEHRRCLQLSKAQHCKHHKCSPQLMQACSSPFLPKLQLFYPESLFRYCALKRKAQISSHEMWNIVPAHKLTFSSLYINISITPFIRRLYVIHSIKCF